MSFFLTMVACWIKEAGGEKDQSVKRNNKASNLLIKIKTL